jgi:rRNA methylases
MSKKSFFIVGKHAVREALKNPSRKGLKIFFTGEKKKNFMKEGQIKLLLKDLKVYFKKKKNG